MKTTFADAPGLLRDAADTMEQRSIERDQKKERAMARTVALFNIAFPENQITESQGWAFMVFLKMSRSVGGNFRPDDFVDMAAYIALWGECEQEQFLKAAEEAMAASDDVRRAS